MKPTSKELNSYQSRSESQMNNYKINKVMAIFQTTGYREINWFSRCKSSNRFNRMSDNSFISKDRLKLTNF